MQFMPANTVASWVQSKRQLQSSGWSQSSADEAIEIRRQLLRELQASGARLLLGSDAPQVFNVPGFSTHRELQVLVEIGFTPYEALFTATVAPGEFLSLSIGKIESGFAADLLLLDDNPLEDITNLQRIHGVMLGGEWIGPQRRTELLEKHRRLR
jgi:imidazolonepropionase-like amidohydrolase